MADLWSVLAGGVLGAGSSILTWWLTDRSARQREARAAERGREQDRLNDERKLRDARAARLRPLYAIVLGAISDFQQVVSIQTEAHNDDESAERKEELDAVLARIVPEFRAARSQFAGEPSSDEFAAAAGRFIVAYDRYQHWSSRLAQHPGIRSIDTNEFLREMSESARQAREVARTQMQVLDRPL